MRRRVCCRGGHGAAGLTALVLDRAGREIEIDSRPSDAIALALRFACPILVSRALLESAVARELGAGRQDIVVKIWGMTVQDLTPALAESLGFEGASGVVVSNVEIGGMDGDLLQRGDVIVAVDQAPVGSVAALRAIVDSGDGARRVEVWRNGGRRVLRVDPGGRAGAAAPSSD